MRTPGFDASFPSSRAEVAAFSMVPMAKPASSMFSIANFPPARARLHTTAIVSSAPANASRAVALIPAIDIDRHQKHGDCSAQRGTARGAENEGIGQRVAKQSLEQHSGRRQPRAYQPRRNDSWKAEGK